MRTITRWAVATSLAAVCLFSPRQSRAGFFYDDGATTLHFAFEGNPNGDWPIVRPPGLFHADDGFGFVDSPKLVGVARSATAPKYFRFDANLPEGNYDVDVMLGGIEGSCITTVKAECHRAMLLDVRAGDGQAVTRTFTVNVRHEAAGGPDGAAPPGASPDRPSLDTDGRLNLEFVGTNPSLMKLDISPNTNAVTVYLIGDSTICDHDDTPFAGWGQMVPLLFKTGEVAVSNHARAGLTPETSDETLKSISKTIKSGDCLLIQFGSAESPDRLDDAAVWKRSVQRYLDEARSHHASAVLLTPPPQRKFDGNGRIVDNFDPLPKWTRELAAEQKVPLIDLNAKAAAFLEKMGPEASAKAFVHYPANAFASHPAALSDDKRTSAYGAFELAKLVSQAISEQKLDLASHLAGGDASNIDPSKFPETLESGFGQ